MAGLWYMTFFFLSSSLFFVFDSASGNRSCKNCVCVARLSAVSKLWLPLVFHVASLRRCIVLYRSESSGLIMSATLLPTSSKWRRRRTQALSWTSSTSTTLTRTVFCTGLEPMAGKLLVVVQRVRAEWTFCCLRQCTVLLSRLWFINFATSSLRWPLLCSNSTSIEDLAEIRPHTLVITSYYVVLLGFSIHEHTKYHYITPFHSFFVLSFWNEHTNACKENNKLWSSTNPI